MEGYTNPCSSRDSVLQISSLSSITSESKKPTSTVTISSSSSPPMNAPDANSEYYRILFYSFIKKAIEKLYLNKSLGLEFAICCIFLESIHSQ